MELKGSRVPGKRAFAMMEASGTSSLMLYGGMLGRGLHSSTFQLNLSHF